MRVEQLKTKFMKKVENEIPEGKKAKWVDGVLTLVDEKPQDITERIKTFEDACEELGDEHPLVKEYWSVVNINLDITQDLISYLKLRIIITALNEGWTPAFDEDECRYYPWFCIYTKEEYEKLDEEEKAHGVPLRSFHNAYANGGLVCAHANGGLVYASANYAGSLSFTLYGVRLVLKTLELAEYCGKQFMDIWVDFLFG